MNNIEQLIAERCPNGVECKELGEVLDYEQPTKYIVRSTTYSNVHTIPVLTAGKSFILGYTDENKGIYSANKENPVIIFDDFTTSFHYVDFDFKIKSSAMKIIQPKQNTDISFRFIYFSMRCIGYQPKNHARHWISNYSKIKIPIPPLDIQKEIVKILDNFTKLEAELKAELKARKKQYEYYREELLSFGDEVEWKALGEVFEIKNGYTPSKTKSEYWNNGTIPWFRMEDIRKNGRILDDSIQHITPEAIKGGSLFPANSIIIATTATIGEHALITVDSLANQRFTFLCKKKNCALNINMKFIFYYCYILAEWCKNNINSASFASVNMNSFKKFSIPIPSLPEQERIVSILDTFDALVNDISTGLPAEIQARKKQYEYYRNKLLTFKPQEEQHVN